MMDKNNVYFAQHCYDHSMKYGNQIIDKIVISFPYEKALPTRRIIPNAPGCLDEIPRGSTLQIHIGGENIDPTKPMILAVYWAFSILVKSTYFVKEVKKALSPYFQQPITQNLVWSFLNELKNQGFSIGQLELAFDFTDDPLSKIFIDRMKMKYGTTYYSNEFKRGQRGYSNDTSAFRVDRTDSILCIYDRCLSLKKDGHALLGGLGAYRLEIRLKQFRRRMIDFEDLMLNMQEFVLLRGSRIKQVVDDHVPEGDVTFDQDYVYSKLPLLPYLISVRPRQIQSPACTNSLSK